MKALWLTLAHCSFLLIATSAYSQSIHDLIGTWHDEKRSTLTITAISPTGQITGTYAPAGSLEKIFLLGWVNADTRVPKETHVVPVIFTVRTDAFGSIVVWTGYLSQNKEKLLSITTIWNMVNANPDADNLANQKVINTAVFKSGVVK